MENLRKQENIHVKLFSTFAAKNVLNGLQFIINALQIKKFHLQLIQIELIPAILHLRSLEQKQNLVF